MALPCTYDKSYTEQTTDAEFEWAARNILKCCAYLRKDGQHDLAEERANL